MTIVNHHDNTINECYKTWNMRMFEIKKIVRMIFFLALAALFIYNLIS
jgi:hypothetical protein